MAQDSRRSTTLAALLVPTPDDLHRLDTFKLKEVPGGFVNLTSYQVSGQMAAILSYGPRFLLPQQDGIPDYMDDFGRLHNYLQHKYGYLDTSQVFLELYNTHHAELEELFSSQPLSYVEIAIRAASREVVSFLKLHRDVLIVESDKGNKTCLMSKEDYSLKMGAYIEKCMSKGVYMEAVPSATDVAFKAFDQLRRDIMHSIDAKMGSIIIPDSLIKGLVGYKRSTIMLPRLYGTVKCHKDGAPMRPICSTIKWPSRAIQKILLHTLKECFSDIMCSQNVINIDHLPNQITSLTSRPGFVLVKMDVNDMYGSMDKIKIAKVLQHLLNHPDVSVKLPFPVGLVERMLHYSLETSCLVTYNGVVYKQVKGLPQGACDSGFLASLYLDTLLQIHREALFGVHHVQRWWKYMDDILLYMPLQYVDSFKNTFERIMDLKLEVEHEVEAWEGPLADYGVETQLSFLDIQISRMNGGRFLVSRYTKPTSSSRMIHALSNTITAYKTNTIRGFIQKILKRTSTLFLVPDLNGFYEQALSNAYPPMLLDHIYHQELRKEMKALQTKTSFFRASFMKLFERFNILRAMLPDFPIGGSNVVQEIRAQFVACRPSSIVFPYRSVAFSRLIQLGCSYAGVGLPVYSRVDQSGAFSAFFAKQSIRQIVEGIEGVKTTTFHVGFVSCTTCGMVFILSGRSRLDAIFEGELANTNSTLSQHQTTFGHHISPIVRRLRAVSGVDASYLSTLYNALFSSVGVSCSKPSLLSQLPMFIRGLLGYMHGLGDFVSTPRVPSPRLEAIFHMELPVEPTPSSAVVFGNDLGDLEVDPLIPTAEQVFGSDTSSDFGVFELKDSDFTEEVKQGDGGSSKASAMIDQSTGSAYVIPDVEAVISASVVGPLTPSSHESVIPSGTVSVSPSSADDNSVVILSDVCLNTAALPLDQSMQSDTSL